MIILVFPKRTSSPSPLAALMRSMWPGLVGNIRSDNTVEIFGKKCYALGADNKKHVSKIQGATFEYVYGDEVTTWNEEVFQMLKSRLRCEHSHFDGTCNPGYPQHWFKQFLDSDADIFQQSYTIDDGCLPPQVVEELKKEYSGTVYYDRFIKGLWVPASGIIYEKFANNTNDYLIDDPLKWCQQNDHHIRYVMIGVDFGGTKSATTFVATGITDKLTVLALDQEWMDSNNLTPDLLENRFTEFVRRVVAVYGRTQTRADSEESVLIRGIRNAVKRAGLPCSVENAKKMSINDRIKLTLLLMAQKRLYVCRKCQHLIDAWQTAIYDPKRFDDTRLDDGTSDIDSLDAWEYSVEHYYQQLLRLGEKPYQSILR